MQASLWPKGLIGRVTMVMLIAILLEFAGSLLLHEQAERRTVAEDHARRVAELLVVGRSLLADTPPADRGAVLHSLSTEHLAVKLLPHPPVSSPTPSDLLRRIRNQMTKWEPSLLEETLTLGTAAGTHGDSDLVGAVRLQDGVPYWLATGDHGPVPEGAGRLQFKNGPWIDVRYVDGRVASVGACGGAASVTLRCTLGADGIRVTGTGVDDTWPAGEAFLREPESELQPPEAYAAERPRPVLPGDLSRLREFLPRR